jgi:hypothetical protein
MRLRGDQKCLLQKPLGLCFVLRWHFPGLPRLGLTRSSPLMAAIPHDFPADPFLSISYFIISLFLLGMPSLSLSSPAFSLVERNKRVWDDTRCFHRGGDFTIMANFGVQVLGFGLTGRVGLLLWSRGSGSWMMLCHVIIGKTPNALDALNLIDDCVCRNIRFQ